MKEDDLGWFELTSADRLPGNGGFGQTGGRLVFDGEA